MPDIAPADMPDVLRALGLGAIAVEFERMRSLTVAAATAHDEHTELYPAALAFARERTASLRPLADENGRMPSADPEIVADHVDAVETRLRDIRQTRLLNWALAMFGDMEGFDTASTEERLERFLEEAIELAQSLDMPKERLIHWVHYVYNRPKGDPSQEFGGVMVTANMLAEVSRISMAAEEIRETKRVLSKTKAHFQARHQAKLDAMGAPVRGD